MRRCCLVGLPIRKDYVSSSKYSKKAPYAMDADFITVHNTWNDAPAKNEVNFMKGNNSSTSFHVAIDDVEIVETVPFNRNAFHAGDGGSGTGNRKSIGIEICYSRNGGLKYIKAEALTIKYIAQLLHERGWGIDRVKKHQDWSGKYCPHRILSEGRWDSFKSAIQAELNDIKGGKVTTIKPAPVVQKGYLEKGDKGTAVKELQTLLEKAGYELGAVDGIFGDATDKAVRAFQKDNKLSVDGLAGNATMQVLEAITAPKQVAKPVAKSKSYLESGDRGDKVKELQTLLNKTGKYKLTVDGIFGNGTEDAVRDFQKANRLAVDGLAGESTIAKLKEVTTKKVAPVKKSSKSYLEEGDKGTEVKALQTLLNKAGNYKLVVDGIFGNGTDKAVRDFQKRNKLTVDGLAGKSTMDKLKKALPYNVYGTLVVKSDNLNVRNQANFKAKVVKVIEKGDKYKVYGVKNGLYSLGGNQFCSAGTEYVSFTKNPNWK